MPIYYDDALPLFARIATDTLDDEALWASLFLRDATGRLTLVLRSEISDEKLAAIAEAATQLFPYVGSKEEAVVTPAQLFDESLEEPNVGRVEFIEHPSFIGFVRVLERRVVGQDWLRSPGEPIPSLPPIVVFASYKGGVGRSTALAVAAAHFGNLNFNILAIDLDLEAPGIGGMLLKPDAMPEFGSLDFFVENGLQTLDAAFFEKLVGVSGLTQGRGLIHVLPAIGSRSKNFPQNVLGKISRAYLDDPEGDGRNKTFLDQARDLLVGISAYHRYDAIFVDARAGLNETTAAAILGLGADVLLFAVNTPQTFEGYSYLLSHLGTLNLEDPSSDWRFRIKMVHAKATASTDEWKFFQDSSFELFSKYFYEEDEEGSDAFNFDVNDKTAPHTPWVILNDANYLEFDPLSNSNQLAPTLYDRTFGNFLDGLRDRLNLEKTAKV